MASLARGVVSSGPNTEGQVELVACSQTAGAVVFCRRREMCLTHLKRKRSGGARHTGQAGLRRSGILQL